MEPNLSKEVSLQVDENPLLKTHLSPSKFKSLFAFTLVTLLVFTGLFFWQIKQTEFLSKKQADRLLRQYGQTELKLDTTTSIKVRVNKASVASKEGKGVKTDSNKVNGSIDTSHTDNLDPCVENVGIRPDKLTENWDLEIQNLMLRILLLMLISGVLGGCLANLRGFYYHWLYFGYFPEAKRIPYYVRPVIGALTGLFVFFLAGFLNSATSYNSEIPKWITITGAIPSLALSFLAGFACLELMSRLKQIAESMFGYKPSGGAVAAGKVGTQVPPIDPDAFRKILPPLTGPVERSIKSRGGVARIECESPLRSLTDVYVINDNNEDIILTITGIVGQMATSRVSVNNQVVVSSAKDEFSLELGKASDLVGVSLRITTLILSSAQMPVGMQVTINTVDYSYLCAMPNGGRASFDTDITFFS